MKLQTQLRTVQSENDRVRKLYYDGMKRDTELLERERMQPKSKKAVYKENLKKEYQAQSSRIESKTGREGRLDDQDGARAEGCS